MLSKGMNRILAIVIAVACLLPALALNARTLAAEGDTVSLTSVVNPSTFSFSITDAKNNDLTDTKNTVEYNEEFYSEMSWEFLPAANSVEVGTKYTYELPSNVLFKNVPSGKIMNGSKAIGDFSIDSNVITLSYFDSDFCNQKDRKGSLVFGGKIIDDGNGGLTAKEIPVEFVGWKEVKIHAVPPTVEPGLAITKKFEDYCVPNPDLLYNCYIRITSTSSNTKVSFYDEMWPGMSLYQNPELYTDEACTIPYTGKHTAWNINNSTNEMSTVIESMSDGEVIYVKYVVQANPLMYDWDSANDFASNYTWAYPYGYRGKIPNYASVQSTETIALEKPLACVWADIYTLHVSFEKFTNQGGSDPDHGMLSWYLYVHKFEDDKITTGYIVDYLPENLTVDMDSFSIFSGDTGVFFDVNDYIKAYTKTDATGKTIVEFHFTQTMIDALKTQNLYFQYKTKVDTQSDKKFIYHNAAEIVLNGATAQRYEEDYHYTKPDEVIKTYEYTPATAPYAYFSIKVNSATLDMSPETDDLVLRDTMGEAFDLDMSSVLVNGVVPNPEDFTYDPTTRIFELKIKDATSYVVTYRSSVNLMPSPEFSGDSGTNVCEIVGITNPNEIGKSKITCEVYKSAANSSSTVYPYLNVIKHETGSYTDTLPGATFDITCLELDGSIVTIDNSSAPVSLETGDNGIVSFDPLNNGIIYMVTESSSPDGYVKDETPRFIVFSNGDSYPAEVEYEGETYALIVIDKTKVSYDMYWANDLTPEDPPPPVNPPVDPPAPIDPPIDPPAPVDPPIDPPAPVDPPITPPDVTPPVVTPPVTNTPTPVVTPTPTTVPVDISGGSSGNSEGTVNSNNSNNSTNSTDSTNKPDSSNASGGVTKTGETISATRIAANILFFIALAFIVAIRVSDLVYKSKSRQK